MLRVIWLWVVHVSLLLSAATIWFWIRSASRPDEMTCNHTFARTGDDRGWSVLSEKGTIRVNAWLRLGSSETARPLDQRRRWPLIAMQRRNSEQQRLVGDLPEDFRSFAGFGYWRKVSTHAGEIGSSQTDRRMLRFPHWALVALMAIAPLIVLCRTVQFVRRECEVNAGRIKLCFQASRRWSFGAACSLSFLGLCFVCWAWITSLFAYDAFTRTVNSWASLGHGKAFHEQWITRLSTARGAREVLHSARMLRDDATPSPYAIYQLGGWQEPPVEPQIHHVAKPSFAFGGFMFSHVNERKQSPGATYTHRHRGWAVAIPYWVLFALFSVLPFVWLRMKYVERRSRKRGLKKMCVGCGYDLRASPERCPECGRVTQTSVPPTHLP